MSERSVFVPEVIAPVPFNLIEAMNRVGAVGFEHAFHEDPGAILCPGGCGRWHWKLGERHRCTGCGHEYNTDHYRYLSGKD